MAPEQHQALLTSGGSVVTPAPRLDVLQQTAPLMVPTSMAAELCQGSQPELEVAALAKGEAAHLLHSGPATSKVRTGDILTFNLRLQTAILTE